MIRLFLTVILLSALSSGLAAGRQRTVKSATTEKQATQKRITETSRRLSDNLKQTEQTMQQLNLLRGEIDQKESQIAATRMQVDSINADIRMAEDSIKILDARLKALKDTYKKALRKLQSSRGFTDELSYIFSSRSFSEAYARMRYVREFGRWRKRKMAEIRRATEVIQNKKARLGQLHSQRKSSLDILSSDQAILKARQNETDQLVTRLQADGRSLQQALEKEKQRLRTIDSEITRMIEAERREKERKERERKAREEQKRKEAEKRKEKTTTPKKDSSGKPKAPAETAKTPGKATAPKAAIDNSDPDAAMSRKFEAAKGSMLFPVQSPYRIVGKYGSAPGQPYNTGIEIVLDGSANARAVFEGTVSRIFQNHDGNYSVMVRHGAYITVYYNIASLAVKAGTQIKAGQNIGTVGVDSRYGKPMLHFEVRKGSQTLNPQSWVR